MLAMQRAAAKVRAAGTNSITLVTAAQQLQATACRSVATPCSQHPALAKPARTMSSSQLCSAISSPASAVTAPAVVPLRSKPIELDGAAASKLLEELDCIMFDCDGVLWTGSTQVPGAAQALRVLREQGKRVLFITNNASKSRAGYVAKFKSLGLHVEAQEIISASYAAAAYLESVGFKATGKKVLLLGQAGVEEEMDTAGIPWVGGSAWQPPQLNNTDDLAGVTLDADIGAVVCSWDPAFSYSRLAYASACLHELPSCLFIVTNPDDMDNIGPARHPAALGQPLPGMEGNTNHTHHTSSSKVGVIARRMMPGTGCLQAALEAAAGRKGVVVGKGGAWLVPYVLQHYNLVPHRTAIVGDRLDTDVALGLAGGLLTLLPLTGVTSRDQALVAPPEAAPHYIMSSVAVLAGLDPTTGEVVGSSN